jgi:trimethylamine--corrinoid protein Co-methyltransferase
VYKRQVVAVADFLVGLLVGQLASEGAPFIMGGLASTMDMRTETVCYGAAELSLLSAGLSSVARYLGIPSFSTGGASDSHVVDTQSAAEGAFSLLVASLSGANLVHGLNYLDGGNTGSVDMITMNEEVIGMIGRIMGGVEVNDETLALDAVHRTGPGGYFLMDDHTMAHFREFWNPTLISRMRYDNWEKAGAKSMGERANEKTKAVLADHTPAPLSDAVRGEIKAIVDRADARA